MTELRVDRLRIRLPDATDADGHQLARIVASRLAEARPSLLARTELPTLQIQLPSTGDLDAIAEAIVEQLLAALSRST